MQQASHVVDHENPIYSPGTKFLIPDLVSHCHFPLRVSPHRNRAIEECETWFFRGANLSDEKRRAYHGHKAGLLTAMCYPKAKYPQLRANCDFMIWLFHMDNISDDMNDRGTTCHGTDVMNVFWCPDTHHPTTRCGQMAKE